MNNKRLFFCNIAAFFMVIKSNDHSNELLRIDNQFATYQSAVRHALLAWQEIEHGITDEKQIIEVVGRLALIKYFFEQAEEHEYAKRRAWSSLERIHWLNVNGCEFGFDFNSETAKLRELVPDWRLDPLCRLHR